MKTKLSIIPVGLFLLMCIFLPVGKSNAQSSFTQTLDIHLNAIRNADLNAFDPTVADTVIHIAPNGVMNKSRVQFMKVHENWFKRKNWQWEGEVVETESNNSTGYALIKYSYSEKDASGNISFKIKCYLALIFNKTDKGWQLVYDQNTIIPESN